MRLFTEDDVSMYVCMYAFEVSVASLSAQIGTLEAVSACVYVCAYVCVCALCDEVGQS